MARYGRVVEVRILGQGPAGLAVACAHVAYNGRVPHLTAVFAPEGGPLDLAHFQWATSDQFREHVDKGLKALAWVTPALPEGVQMPIAITSNLMIEATAYEGGFRVKEGDLIVGLMISAVREFLGNGGDEKVIKGGFSHGRCTDKGEEPRPA